MWLVCTPSITVDVCGQCAHRAPMLFASLCAHCHRSNAHARHRLSHVLFVVGVHTICHLCCVWPMCHPPPALFVSWCTCCQWSCVRTNVHTIRHLCCVWPPSSTTYDVWVQCAHHPSPVLSVINVLTIHRLCYIIVLPDNSIFSSSLQNTWRLRDNCQCTKA